MTAVETDYLIIGAGAVGLAFADTLLDEDPDADIIIVDKHGQPGGHWNDAYNFVALHQPSAFYGVNSLELGSGRVDESGYNKGFLELASGPEVTGYFHKVMHQKLIPSGRVRYFPMSAYIWPKDEGADKDADQSADGSPDEGSGHMFRHLLSGEEKRVTVRKKLVDATYYATSVPSTHKRKFSVSDGVRCVPPNDLPQLWKDPAHIPQHFCILGAGKTAMDVGVWLRNSGTRAENISWVCPRDSWLLNRACTQPGMEFFDSAMGGQVALAKGLAEAEDITDLFHRLEADGFMLRIHGDVEPQMFHYATISEGEVEILRGIDNVIRMGRVESIDHIGMTLAHGRRDMPADTLYIDCTATAVELRDTVPMFQPDRIVLQMARIPQPAFSAAICAYLEVHRDNDAERNRLCMPVKLPDTMDQYPAACMANMVNQMNWGNEGDIRKWMIASRLDGFSATVAAVPPSDKDKTALLMDLRKYGRAAGPNIGKLIMQAQAKADSV